MRRSVAAAVALGTALSLSVLADSAVARGTATGPSAAAGSSRTDARAEAQRALRTADRVLSGADTRTDPSMALLRLRLTMNHLPTTDRRQAAAILARPTDHPDFYGQTYSVKAKKKCAGHICIHWVPTTRDAPPGARWVNKMLKMMNNVWTYEVKKLGYHRPISDGTRGGRSGMFDVYLKELYHQGLYGLTVAEQRTSYNKHLYSSYLLIDNDFKRSQFRAAPMQVARVTAAHEFFHAIQYGYDVTEDPWLMESTATWMEDQFDDSSNDNRQYLPWSQLRRPGTPLDTFDNASFEQYGNWVFFEYLSEHYGRRVVRSVWNHAAAFHGGGHEYSAAAIRSALHKDGGMTAVFGKYASGNTVPGHAYSEGRAYPAAPLTSKVTLTKAAPATPWTTYGVHHLASVNLRAVPGADLLSRKWQLQVKVDGPRRATAPVVVVLVKRTHHPMTRMLIHLRRSGAGHVSVPFSRAATTSVTVTLANASTRFTCHTGGGYSCDGTSKAPHPPFKVRLTALRR
jgi:Family of unknown function (DUF6055)